MKIDGRFWLTKNDQNFLGSGRIELLEQIDKTGSIHAAAKVMKMSYKAAWERINSMNLLAEKPLIERTTGGKGGGGTKLTPYAQDLIITFKKIELLHRQFMDRFSEAGESPEKLARILSRTFLTTSARNQLPSILSDITINGLNASLTLSLDPFWRIQSNITLKSVQNMGLEIGCDVYAIIKSSDIKISASMPESSDTELNIIHGNIHTIESGNEINEVIFHFGDHHELIASVPKSDSVSFITGMKAYAIISSKNIILGL